MPRAINLKASLAQASQGLGLGLGVGLMLAGCGTPANTVYIDRQAALNQILNEERSMRAPGPTEKLANAVRPPNRTGVVTVTLPSVSARDVKTVSRSQEQLRSQLQQEYSAALRNLTARLNEFYRSDLNQFILGLQSLEGPNRQSLDGQFLVDLRQIFDESAEKVGPRKARLAFLAGFPDEAPDQKEPNPELPKYRQEREAEAIRLRKEIKEIDQKFEEQRKILLDARLSRLETFKQELATKIATYEAQLNERAEKEAARQVKNIQQSISLKLSEARALVYPPIPGSSSSSGPIRALPKRAEVPSNNKAVDAGWTNKQLNSELTVWAELNHVVVSSNRRAGRDATREFQTWRTTRKLGR